LFPFMFKLRTYDPREIEEMAQMASETKTLTSSQKTNIRGLQHSRSSFNRSGRCIFTQTSLTRRSKPNPTVSPEISFEFRNPYGK
jgi:hypothetical protein